MGRGCGSHKFLPTSCSQGFRAQPRCHHLNVLDGSTVDTTHQSRGAKRAGREHDRPSSQQCVRKSHNLPLYFTYAPGVDTFFNDFGSGLDTIDEIEEEQIQPPDMDTQQYREEAGEAI